MIMKDTYTHKKKDLQNFKLRRSEFSMEEWSGIKIKKKNIWPHRYKNGPQFV